MADGMELTGDVREFERAMMELARESDRADDEVLLLNARTLLKSLVYNTPRDTGNTRAGFWPAWAALDLPGTPGTRRSPGQTSTDYRGRTLVSAGTVDDERTNRAEPAISWSVRSYLIDTGGKRIAYPWVLNAKADFWGKGLREATGKFGRAHERLLKKHSRR